MTSSETTFWETANQGKWGRYITEVEKRIILEAHHLTSESLFRDKNSSIALEVGCEGGRWSQLLTELGWKMICTDVDPTTLALCQKRLPDAKCILVSEKDIFLPCESESLKILLCIEVPEAIGSDWFITEAYRVLQEGGYVVGVFFNSQSLRGWFRNLIASTTKGFQFQYKVSYAGWRLKFCQQGFKMIEQEGIGWFPFGRYSNSPLIPIGTYLEKLVGLRKIPSLSPWIVFLAKKENPSNGG